MRYGRASTTCPLDIYIQYTRFGVQRYEEYMENITLLETK